MADSLSVHEALDQLPQLSGQGVAVHGILHFEFEHLALWHYPKAERRHASFIWLSTGTGAVQFNDRALEKMNGRRVSVLGTLYAPDPEFGGCGHMSCAPAEIQVSAIDRL